MATELRVFVLKECIINPAPAPASERVRTESVGLAAIFVPKLIEFAIGNVAKLLKDAGADKTVQATGSAFTDMFIADKETRALGVNSDIGCVLAVCGDFDGDSEEKLDPDDRALQVLQKHGLITDRATIDIVFEAAVRPSADASAFHLDTRHFSVRSLIGDRDKGDRRFVLTFTMSTASATVAGDTIALGNIDFGTLQRGADLVPWDRSADGYPQYRSNLMPWGQISGASKAAYDADFAGGRARSKRYMPVTFGVTLSQTEKGHPFLAKLGELLDGSKQEAATAISKLILPEERAKTTAAAAEAAENLYIAELQAELDVREAQKKLDAAEAPDKPTERVRVEMAKRKRDRAVALRKAAGLPDRPAVP
jgi:hypothetical protein